MTLPAVLLDEFHERSLQADLALALSLQSQEILRPDLRIVLMSATLDGDALRDFLGARLVTSEGRVFRSRCATSHSGTGARVEESVARTVLAALAADAGSILAFLPGAGDPPLSLDSESSALRPALNLIPLFGALASDEQGRRHHAGSCGPTEGGTRHFYCGE